MVDFYIEGVQILSVWLCGPVLDWFKKKIPSNSLMASSKRNKHHNPRQNEVGLEKSLDGLVWLIKHPHSCFYFITLL